MKKAPGTLALLLRWHFLPFAVGGFVVLFAGYQLVTHEVPKAIASSPFAGVASSPVSDHFVSIMWLFLMVGLIVAGRAVTRARAMAGSKE